VALKTEELYDKAMHLSKDVEDNFLELGRTLRQLSDRDTDLFTQMVAKSNIRRRKAYYLVEVSRIFDPLPVPRSRLKKIGWTKLQLIGKHVTPDNLNDLLTLCENNNAKEIERQMRGEAPKDNAHCVLMYFSPNEFAELEEALVENGANRVPQKRGAMQGKESALIKLVRSWRAAKPRVREKAQ
jgi:hypothetical protein